MKPNVNKDVCQAIAENIFEIDSDGLAKAIVDEVPEEDKENAIEASESCPTGAISVD